jgi:uncharacterized protein YndB with AHSA1/START domain
MAGRGAEKSKDSHDREIIITRLFDAPRERVWDAWIDPEKIVRWWGPSGFSLTVHEMDVRPGGVWRSTMHGPDGTDYLNDCVFIEVVKLERIVYHLSGGKTEDWDSSAEVSWIFEAVGSGTRLTLRTVFPTAEVLAHSLEKYRVIEGGNQTLDRLQNYVAR